MKRRSARRESRSVAKAATSKAWIASRSGGSAARTMMSAAVRENGANVDYPRIQRSRRVEVFSESLSQGLEPIASGGGGILEVGGCGTVIAAARGAGERHREAKAMRPGRRYFRENVAALAERGYRRAPRFPSESGPHAVGDCVYSSAFLRRTPIILL